MKLLIVICMLFLISNMETSVEANQSYIYSTNLTLKKQDDSSSDKSTDTQTSREKKK
jgi:hypothetical protein